MICLKFIILKCKLGILVSIVVKLLEKWNIYIVFNLFLNLKEN